MMPVAHPKLTNLSPRSLWLGLCWGHGWIQSLEIESVFKAKIMVLSPMETHVLDVFASRL